MANFYDATLNQLLKKQSKQCGLASLPSVGLQCPSLEVQYYGSHSYYAIVSHATTGLTFSHDNTNGTTTVDPNIGQASGAQTELGVIDLGTPNATIDTMGELVDWINNHVNYGLSTGNTNWHAFMNGCIRSEVSGNTNSRIMAISSVASAKPTKINLYPTMGEAPCSLGFSVTNRKFTGANTWTDDIGYLNSIDYLSVDVLSTGGFVVNIYDVYDGNTPGLIQNEVSKTLLFTSSQADTTALAIAFTADWGHPITAEVGHRLLVTVVGAAAVTLPNTTFGTEHMRVLGSTVKVY